MHGAYSLGNLFICAHMVIDRSVGCGQLLLVWSYRLSFEAEHAINVNCLGSHKFNSPLHWCSRLPYELHSKGLFKGDPIMGLQIARTSTENKEDIAHAITLPLTHTPTCSRSIDFA